MRLLNPPARADEPDPRMLQAREEVRAGAARKAASKKEKKARRAARVTAAIEYHDVFAAWEADPDTPAEELLGCYARGDELVSVDELFCEMVNDLVIMAASNEPEPSTIKEALTSDEADLWRTALEEEFSAIKKMGVYKLIP
jgi:hypothetical protein